MKKYPTIDEQVFLRKISGAFADIKKTTQLGNYIADRLVDKFPNNIENVYQRAVCLKKNGSFHTAKEQFEKCILLSPNMYEAIWELAVLMKRFGKHNEEV